MVSLMVSVLVSVSVSFVVVGKVSAQKIVVIAMTPHATLK